MEERVAHEVLRVEVVGEEEEVDDGGAERTGEREQDVGTAERDLELLVAGGVTVRLDGDDGGEVPQEGDQEDDRHDHHQEDGHHFTGGGEGTLWKDCDWSLSRSDLLSPLSEENMMKL